MSKKVENVFFKVTGVFAVLVLVLGLYLFYTSEEDLDNNKNLYNENINRNNQSKSFDIIGEFVVKDDKNSKLIIKDNGEYELNINLCNGYLTTTGKYELVENKLRLLNEKVYNEYPSLKDNYEFSLSVVDDNTLRLEEDLVCLFQKTLFER